jgi:hypothetical protein
MTQWRAKRDAPKTKAELREMLAEAIRNTAQPETKRQPLKGKTGAKLPERKKLG